MKKPDYLYTREYCGAVGQVKQEEMQNNIAVLAECNCGERSFAGNPDHVPPPPIYGYYDL